MTSLSIATQSPTGKDKGRNDGLDRFPSTLSLPFPIKGKGVFIFLRVEHKLMIHFVVDILLADYTPSMSTLADLKKGRRIGAKDHLFLIIR